MNFANILDLISKAETVASVLIEAGKSAAPAWDAIKNLFKDKKTITPADIADADKVLDALLAEFNEELPPE